MGKAKKTIYKVLIGKKLGKNVVVEDALQSNSGIPPGQTPASSQTQTGQILSQANQQLLAQHDKQYHPNGYKQGDKCKFRENLGLGKTPDEYDDEVDFLGDASSSLYNAVKEVNQLAKNPQYQVDTTKLDEVDALVPVLTHIAKHDHQAKTYLDRATALANYRKNGFQNKIGRVSKFDVTKWRNPHAAQNITPAAQASAQPQPSQSQPPTTAIPAGAQQLKADEQNLITTVGKLNAQVANCPQALKGIFQKALGIAQQNLANVQKQLGSLASKVSSLFRLNLGKDAMIQDGDTGKVINDKRIDDGLKPYVSMDNIDALVDKATKDFQVDSAALARKYGEPDLDISNPQVFADVQKNYCDTVKRLVTENKICTVIKAHRLIDFLNAGFYQTKYTSESEKQENYDYAYGLPHSTSSQIRKSAEEAPISATLLSSDLTRMFKSTAFDVYGCIAMEWRKDGDLVPCFSNCDISAPLRNEVERDGNGNSRVFNPCLVSNPSICSLASFADGSGSLDWRMSDRLNDTGVRSANGLMMPSHTAAIKLFRQGPLQGDAFDFDCKVNNAQMSPWVSPRGKTRNFGWNEVQMIGRGNVSQVASIFIDSQKWAAIRQNDINGSTNQWATAQSYVNDLVKSHGQMLKQNGIKLVLDGQEIQL